MTNIELIQLLSTFPPDIEVLLHSNGVVERISEVYVGNPIYSPYTSVKKLGDKTILFIEHTK